MNNDSIKRIEELFKHHIGVLSEDFQYKLDLVVEGQQMLAERLELTRTELKDEIRKVDQRLTMVEARLEQKIDAVAVDLTAHRADTEAHHGVYRVKEG
ncbi:hypothetical protein [Geobacter sp.]|uniref:hypothetical protein n=1 Tax=Geobacter sp. TaxID=46610 RepID=UPI00262FD835|nr:hypothetical protein [Geobacter sp.]